jgi:hypothetical protein
MASYWIVVPRGNTELFDLLSVAFQGRTDFSVIEDRRSGGARPADTERRSAGSSLGPDEIIIAEQAERRTVAEEPQRRGSRVPVRRRRVRRGSSRTEGGQRAAPAGPAGRVRDQRLLTL